MGARCLARSSGSCLHSSIGSFLEVRNEHNNCSRAAPTWPRFHDTLTSTKAYNDTLGTNVVMAVSEAGSLVRVGQLPTYFHLSLSR